MSRRTMIAALVGCLALLAVVLVTWAASYERVGLGVFRGKLYVVTSAYPENLHWILEEGSRGNPASNRLEGLRFGAKAQWQAFGLDYIDSDIATAYGVSLLYAALLAACGAGWFGYLLRRRRRRERLGLCLACGYDLRETAGRCPECGRERGAEAARRATEEGLRR